MTDDPNEYTTFSALFRIVDGYTPASEYSEALVFEAGELAEPLKLTPTELATAIRSWAFEHGDRERTVELRRAETDIGAAGVDLALVVTFFAGVAAEVALEELYQFVRSRLFRITPERQTLDYLRSLEDDHLVDELRARVARATDRRSSDLRVVQMHRDAGEVNGVFETASGHRYVIRVADELYRIARAR